MAGLGRKLARWLRGLGSPEPGVVLGWAAAVGLSLLGVFAREQGAFALAATAGLLAVCAAFAAVFRASPPRRGGRLVALRRRYQRFAEVYSVGRLAVFAVGVSAAVLVAAFALLR